MPIAGKPTLQDLAERWDRAANELDRLGQERSELLGLLTLGEAQPSDLAALDAQVTEAVAERDAAQAGLRVLERRVAEAEREAAAAHNDELRSESHDIARELNKIRATLANDGRRMTTALARYDALTARQAEINGELALADRVAAQAVANDYRAERERCDRVYRESVRDIRERAQYLIRGVQAEAPWTNAADFAIPAPVLIRRNASDPESLEELVPTGTRGDVAIKAVVSWRDGLLAQAAEDYRAAVEDADATYADAHLAAGLGHLPSPMASFRGALADDADALLRLLPEPMRSQLAAMDQYLPVQPSDVHRADPIDWQKRREDLSIGRKLLRRLAD